MLKDSYNIIVVGGGPAGTTAARYAAAGGVSVLVLEKDRDIGYPVRCGEAVDHPGLVQFIEPDSKWIASTVTKFRFNAPNGTSVIPVIKGVGYILERRIFDYELAKLAAIEGAEIITKAYVYDLIKTNGVVEGVKVLIKDQPVEIRSKLVIAADGVESRAGKWAGIDTTTAIDDMESCAQVTVSGIEIDEDICDFYFGKEFAPGGYLWVFPKGKKSANIGLGVPVDLAKKKSAIRYLEDFLEKRFPNAAILTRIAGGVPCAKTCDTLVKNNVVLVGDAAHQVNPISGGGIISGMVGGMLAGQAASESIKTNEFTHLEEYPRQWQKRFGWKHEAYYNLKDGINLPDEVYNRIADDINKLPPEKRTLGAIFRAALWNRPSLLLEVAKVFLS